MILDSLNNMAAYETLHPRFAIAFDYIRQTDLDSMEPGRYQIEGDNVFMNLMVRDLKLPEKAPLEVHDEYIDIQVVIRGTETFGWLERSRIEMPDGVMDIEKDVLFAGDKPSTYYTLSTGEFCIFFPHDGHAPMIGDGKSSVKKCIVKVRK